MTPSRQSPQERWNAAAKRSAEESVERFVQAIHGALNTWKSGFESDDQDALGWLLTIGLALDGPAVFAAFAGFLIDTVPYRRNHPDHKQFVREISACWGRFMKTIRLQLSQDVERWNSAYAYGSLQGWLYDIREYGDAATLDFELSATEAARFGLIPFALDLALETRKRFGEEGVLGLSPERPIVHWGDAMYLKILKKSVEKQAKKRHPLASTRPPGRKEDSEMRVLYYYEDRVAHHTREGNRAPKESAKDDTGERFGLSISALDTRLAKLRADRQRLKGSREERLEPYWHDTAMDWLRPQEP